MNKTRVVLVLLFLLWGIPVSAEKQSHPNILWITCEDISPYLGCYGFKQAKTPNLDRLAQEGVRYNRAYAISPVCAVSRATLLTGMYSSSIGTHHMRSRMQLPATIPALPKILRSAGYYCSNNSKKDYNSTFENDSTIWDESSGKAHFRKRKNGQPFFSVFNITVTHESQLNGEKIEGYVARNQIPATPRIDPKDISLPPIHPDLPEFRNDWARFHDLITLMDEMVGQRLRELEQDGLADDTIVFFYSDHGGQLSRTKRYIYNAGTQVPLIIRFPKKWRHLAPAAPGNAEDRLVNFADLPKTVLSLVGVTAPALMQGRVFLGPNAEPAPSFVHFSRDRMAERNDFSRAITDGRWYFVRNFMPHRPLAYDTRYGFTVQSNWTALEKHFEAGKCDAVQAQFFQPKPVLQLFDTQSDPWHVRNLAALPEHQERLRKMETALDSWMIETRDIGMIPETLFHDLVGEDKPVKTLYEYAQSDRYSIERLLKVAKEASLGDPKHLSDYLKFMNDKDPIVRHWGAYGAFLVRSQKQNVQKKLKEMMANDSFAGNRIMAAQALGRSGEPDAAFQTIFKEARDAAHPYVFLQALNAFQYGHVDDRLKQEDWQSFKDRTFAASKGVDTNGVAYAQRIVDDALEIWPKRRKVD